MSEAMILPLIGRKRLASIIAGTTAFDMAYVAVGTGGTVALDENQTTLRHEVCRATILEYSHSGNQLVINAVLMPCYTVAQVNEIGVFAADGTLLIVGLLPATTTSASIEQGAKTSLRFRISITVGNDGTTTILMDNNTALAFIDMSNVVSSDIVARGVAWLDMSNVTQAAIAARGISKDDLSNSTISSLLSSMKQDLATANSMNAQ